ncbi:DUF5011 domain-containing protein [Arachidicoccus soli]|nr:DUF5011 domain-containing protein [Arachidicoccus soli]
MRNFKKISFIFLIAIGLFSSCTKSIINTADQVGISKVTYYATITLKGNQYESIVKGNPYSDEGATATAGGNSLNVIVSGTVNTNAVGLYTISYSAKNKDGFSATSNRVVAVLPSAEQSGIDISGSYYYVSTGANNSTITKLAPGFYSTSNCWSSATTIGCLFICIDGTNIIMPNQSTPFGQLFGTGTLSGTGALTYIVSIPSQGINNSSRKWHKAN